MLERERFLQRELIRTASRDRRGSRRQETAEETSRKEAAAENCQRSVDRTGRPTCTRCTGVPRLDRSTGPVDRSESAGFTELSVWDRSTGPVDRWETLKINRALCLFSVDRIRDQSTGKMKVGRLSVDCRSTDSRVLGEICCFEKSCI